MTENDPQHTGEWRLWVAVLNRAVQDALAVTGNSSSQPAQYEQQEARKWLRSKSSRPCSCRWAIQALGADPDKIQPRLVEMEVLYD